MIAWPRFLHPASYAASRQILGFAAVFLGAGLLCAKPDPATVKGGPKEFIVYNGADLFTRFDSEILRVVGVKGTALDLESDSGVEVVSAWKTSPVAVARRLKFGTFEANIDLQRVEVMRIALAQSEAELNFATSSVISSEERALEHAVAEMQIKELALGASNPAVVAQREQLADQSNRLEDMRELFEDYVTEETNKPDGPKTASLAPLPFEYAYDPMSDALEFKCSISSPRPLAKAFLAVTLRYVAPNAPTVVQAKTRFQSFNRLTGKPRKVKFVIRDLPLGFHLVGCDFDLFSDGEQVATNLSKSVEAVNEEHVYQYFLRDYLIRNRAQTRAAKPLLLASAEALRLQVNKAGLEQVVFVVVDKLGNTVSLSADGVEARDLPEQVMSVLQHVRFLPALEDGQPVDGRLRLRVGDLF